MRPHVKKTLSPSRTYSYQLTTHIRDVLDNTLVCVCAMPESERLKFIGCKKKVSF